MRKAAHESPRFDTERFIEDCKCASQETTDAQPSVQEVLAPTVSNPVPRWQRRAASLAPCESSTRGTTASLTGADAATA
jgi:hypothetical protein